MTVINGKVTDAETGEGMPFVNVYFQGTQIGTTSDFEGNYTLKTETPTDSVVVSYIGYVPRTKAVQRGVTQTILFQLLPDAKTLDEVVVEAGENPAFAILRDVVRHKNDHDIRRLSAYEYESYNKIEIDIDNLSDKLRKRPVMRQISRVLDSLDQIAGDDGKPILPIFLSESVSTFYYRDSPQKKREEIQKTKVTGVGMDDGTLLAQVTGASFQQYNFYKNWLNILGKDFVSPIADGWNLYYDYLLEDSLYLGEDYCYRLDFAPKQVGDLAFRGSVWITKHDFALKQVDVTVGKDANLNYVEKIKIQQELVRTEAGPWLPAKNRVVVDIAELTENSAGMIAKFYNSNRAMRVNQPHDVRFYDSAIELAQDALIEEKNYWQEHRHDSLTSTEVAVYEMIDTIRNLPVVKTYVEVANVLVNGYKKVGMVDIGPYLDAYAFNSVEGQRFRLGFKTNIDFSRKFILKGYAAYGTRDHRWKYGAGVDYIVSRKPWTQVGVRRTYDIGQVALLDVDVAANPIFATFIRFGNLRNTRPFFDTENYAYLRTELVKGLSPMIELRNRHFDPLYNFAYYTTPEHDETAPIASEITVSEATLSLRYARDEMYLQNDNERIQITSDKWPAVTLRYTQGFQGVMGGDFSYHKWNLSASQTIPMSFLGHGYYQLDLGYIPSTLPYPLLKSHIGNQSIFYSTAAFNLMNYFEFVSDTWASMQYQHSFEGFFLNRIPLMRRLKWRMVATGNVLYGSLRPANQALSYEFDGEGTAVMARSLGRAPYAEVGYGIENIFKLVRVDFVHRLTYLDNPNARRFGVLVSMQFKL
ncbi:CarboxypepD_reg-like domain-containing protein [Catalinimonas alkaloidigena]|uniref:CarboxypepD_reg-like domain-containing protein n=2 Tax=Catalinimonas alkaloidigena TaxID=1075417 RepID=A0A1G9S4U3_9BACT|nr:CarboxypepD_reg-like domain-containing protein [Catalinimonas alkaloidigena]